jgi:hypothetical protein
MLQWNHRRKNPQACIGKFFPLYCLFGWCHIFDWIEPADAAGAIYDVVRAWASTGIVHKFLIAHKLDVEMLSMHHHMATFLRFCASVSFVFIPDTSTLVQDEKFGWVEVQGYGIVVVVVHGQ